MIKKILLTLAVVASGVIAVQGKDWANLARYDKSNKEIMAQKNDGRRVVFLGNSITEGWVAKHPQFFTDNGFIGRGISGQTSYQYLVRFREDVINLEPKLVIINAATNDVAENTDVYDEDRTFGNIITLVELAKLYGIKVILTSALPADGIPWNPEIKNTTEKITSLNARVRDYAKKNKIPYVDYYPAMLADDGRALNPAYTNDGIHPTEAGYDVMEALILPAIRKIVK